jgi:hypothetical protein
MAASEVKRTEFQPEIAIPKIRFRPEAEVTLLLRLGMILACTPMPHLFQRDPNKVDGGVTGVAGIVFIAQVNGVHPTDCAVFSDDS